MAEQKKNYPIKVYSPPEILSISIAPDITKCMQNTGGIVPSSTFNVYRELKKRIKM